jgi:uncharacterized protein HemX
MTGGLMKNIVILSVLLLLAGGSAVIYQQGNKRLEEAITTRDNQIESLQKRVNMLTMDTKELTNQLKEKEAEQEQIKIKEEADEKHFNETNDEDYNKWGAVKLPAIVVDFLLHKKLYR